MLTPNELLDAVKSVLKERFPGETIYTNVAPKDFDRPSFLVFCGPVKIMDASAATIEVAVSISVTAFLKTDARNNSVVESLLERMMAVLELFAIDGLEVGERVLHLTGPTGVCSFDDAEITIPVQYFDDRPEREEPWETMEDVAVRTTPSA